MLEEFASTGKRTEAKADRFAPSLVISVGAMAASMPMKQLDAAMAAQAIFHGSAHRYGD
ncbi:hypothetical protein [Rhodanobacter umsongensis]